MKHFNVSTVYSFQDENTCESTVIPSLTVFVSQIHLADISHKAGGIYIDSSGLSPDFNWRKWKQVLAQQPGVYWQLNIRNMWKDTDHYQWWLTLFTFDMKDLSPGMAKASRTNFVFVFQPILLKQSSFFTTQAVTGPRQLLWPLTSPPDVRQTPPASPELNVS